MEQAIIAGVAHDRSEAKITVVGVPDKVGEAARIFEALAGAEINIDMVVQNVSAAATGLTDISFTLPRADGQVAMSALARIRDEVGYDRLLYDDQVGKISLIGAGMRSHPGITATFFAALASAGVNIEMISTSEIRMTRVRLAVLDLAEGNAMRAPGEAPGLMALEIAMDEMAEKLGMDPVQFRILNDTQVDPEQPDRRFSTRPFVECLQTGAERFGWNRRNARPASIRDGRWLVGMGMAGAIRGAPINRAGARVRLDRRGVVTVETDMTDIGTGSYTIVAQTAAEMMGVSLDKVVARLGDSSFPETPGSGGQQGAPSVTAGVYAACVKLREAVAQRLGFNSADVAFTDGEVRSGNRSVPLARAAEAGDIVVEDVMEYGDLKQRFAQQTFGAHFAEVAVDAYTGETRVRRLLAVCAAGRILNPKMARSQVIGGMTMGIGAALMEEMVVDKRFGFFVNHDLAGYEVPVHADIPQLEAFFVEEVDPTMSPLKAKGVGELGLTGVAPAVANAVYNATGIRVRDYPITLNKLLDRLPDMDES